MRPKKRKLLNKTLPVKVSDILHDETKECARIAQESVSEYVRNAVKERNKSVKKGGE